ncbi:MtrAB system histidine kinase MtrB [Kribbella solani]|uniref:Sensor histidine kinase MtrB n=1 Tax=Kribbella solani TaxID=236067 RepID=A0A841DUM4_9ACTN|nr:MtrAB system histidine kinase MtrB [Kribbella solani]MBB5980466.1 two-component system sensor histidine kinase MtrB [Kribbella solani]MDX2973609.1 MtrAB system histidine kinase MtrB [Kribbella solani]MDX3004376.1 MtrAB system histidine kinase MtrB [Kribbella solani]
MVPGDQPIGQAGGPARPTAPPEQEVAESRGTELELTAAAADWAAQPKPLWRTHPKHWPDHWRRSIQARIVTGTLLMSTLVLILVGWVMMSQVTDGVLESRRTSAQAEVRAQLAQLSSTIDAADRSTINQQLSELVLGTNRPGLYDVLLVPTDQAASNAIRYTGLVDSDSIPQALTSSVMSDGSKLYDTYTKINYREAPSVPGLVIGSQIRINSTGDRYAIYFLFPLTGQQETLDVVQRALVTAGLLLIVLLGAVAWLVTRQVVTPVRMARRIAERLAAGKLEERMQVRGTDDLARLAVSFNKMASNLQRQIRRLEELSRLQRRFVSDVSHELRTPLTTVRMAADLLHESRDQFDPISRRSVELLQNELNRFEELLADLLEISRFDAGAAALDLEDVDLRDIVTRVLENHETLLERKGCPVELDMPAPCRAKVDSRRIERILRNLIGNAIEHSEGLPIRISTAYDDDAAAVAVRDHGVGFRPEEAEMVFSRFWRADPARARTTGGTGLGLSIALEDARLHGGRLDAWGSPGDGAYFRLTLPRRPDVALTGSPLPPRPADATRVVTELVDVGAPYQKLNGGTDR